MCIADTPSHTLAPLGEALSKSRGLHKLKIRLFSPSMEYHCPGALKACDADETRTDNLLQPYLRGDEDHAFPWEASYALRRVGLRRGSESSPRVHRVGSGFTDADAKELHAAKPRMIIAERDGGPWFRPRVMAQEICDEAWDDSNE